MLILKCVGKLSLIYLVSVQTCLCKEIERLDEALVLNEEQFVLL